MTRHLPSRCLIVLLACAAAALPQRATAAAEADSGSAAAPASSAARTDDARVDIKTQARTQALRPVRGTATPRPSPSPAAVAAPAGKRNDTATGTPARSDTAPGAPGLHAARTAVKAAAAAQALRPVSRPPQPRMSPLAGAQATAAAAPVAANASHQQADGGAAGDGDGDSGVDGARDAPAAPAPETLSHSPPAPADPAAADAGWRPQPFRAVYRVQHAGARVGETTLTLVPLDDSRWRLRSRTAPRGLAALVHPGDVVETSEFDIADGELRTLHYVFDDGTRAGRNDAQVDFDWRAGQARARFGDSDASLPLQRGAIDRLLVQVALMRDLARGGRSTSYTVVDRNSTHDYDFTILDNDVVDVGAGQFTATRLRRQRPGSSRATLVWAAAKLGNLPVKIAQYKDGRPTIVLTLTAYDFDPPPDETGGAGATDAAPDVPAAGTADSDSAGE